MLSIKLFLSMLLSLGLTAMLSIKLFLSMLLSLGLTAHVIH